ncbi:MAG: DNA ligase-associated DEXH box helicase [Chlamydiales bacterium 38-26]|nr:ligase-associated DNA damage response DEXH box helicase [Chlamydiales bacterium]OJV07470.1 MAG: DNA ligase-associated DEXH box helicase [Chlamydiales bacterium 38-26]
MNPDLKLLYKFFKQMGIHPWPFQEECWKAYLEGENGLIYVPTGSGKTYAAFGGPLAQLIREPGRGIQILYITPLRALANDVHKALLKPIELLNLPFKVEMRTGDTSQIARQKQKKSPPEILLTTPESLALLLTDPHMQGCFKELKAVIVDEWHELLGNKRGVMLELLLSQLCSIATYQLWGMSATLGNRQVAAQVLGGKHHTLKPFQVESKRVLMIETLLPETLHELPGSGFFGLQMFPYLLQKLDLDQSTLLFTNTRAQAEKWYEKIIQEKPEWKAKIAIHHSSIDLIERRRIEEATKAGELRLVICTSSLDLGVDFPLVERVIQIGSTKSVARLIQRAGRSNHRPWAPCYLLWVPTHAMELIEFLSLRKALDQHFVEAKTPLKDCWDVLIQHIISKAIGGFTKNEIFQEITNTFAFSQMSLEQLAWMIEFLEKGGRSLEVYPEFHKLKFKNERYLIEDRRLIQLHRMSLGTIPTGNMLALKYLSGKRIGVIEESFVNRLKPQETFIFGGKSYQLLRTNQSEAVVRLSKKPALRVAQWIGTRLPLSSSVSAFMRDVLAFPDSFESYPEYSLFADVLKIQNKISQIPAHQELLVEVMHTKKGWHLFFYPFESRSIHQTLNTLVAFRLLKKMKSSFTLACNDYGCEILSAEPFVNLEDDFKELFTETNLEEDLNEAVNISEMGKTTFRDIARIAGLVIQGFISKRKSLRQIQMTTSLLYEVFTKFDPTNLLLQQAKQEVLVKDLELQRLKDVLQRIRTSAFKFVQLRKLSPFALPIYVEGESQYLSNEDLKAIMEKIQKSWVKT